MSFTSLKGNCLICAGQRKDCRQSDDSGLVFCRSDLNQAPRGWRYIKDDCNGFGIFAPDDGDGGYTPLPKRAKSKPKPTVAPLATTERDRQYRSIAERCGLLSVHRADLRRRGLTDSQVNLLLQRGLIWSWDSGYSPGISANLPGADGADSLRNFSGLAIAVPTATGKIQGAQIRPRQGKYFWVSSEKIGGAGSNLPSGELPIGVYFPAGDSDASIVNLAEGFLKPAIAALTHGQIFVGAAGGNFASSQAETLAAIQALGAHTVVLNADGGAVGNRHVMRAYARLQDSLSAAGISLMVRWWGQVTKQDGDVDEISPEQFQAARLIDWSEFEAIARRRGGVGKQKIFAQIISQIRKAIPLRLRGQKPQQQIDCEYQDGDRIATWQAAYEAGYKYVLDNSGTGGGKSFSAGQLQPSDFEGINQLLYLSDQHRNPTVPTLKEWTDLEARHSGLVGEMNPDGSTRYRRRRSGEQYSIAENCSRTKIVNALRAKNVNGADTAGLVCGPCPLREKCTHSEGTGFGFLKQRSEALQEPRLRAHPDSTPPTADYRYEKAAAIWDEPGRNFKTANSLVVTKRDFEQLTLTLASQNPALLVEIQPFLNTLTNAIAGDITPPGRYGWSTPKELLDLLGELPTVDVPDLKEALLPNLSFLNPAAAYGEEMADLPASVRQQFAESEDTIAESAEREVPKQWLIDFLAIASGEKVGWLTLNHGKLTITQPNNRHRELVEAMGFNIFLDATLTREGLAQKLGCDPADIYVCQQIQPRVENLTITQVIDVGRMGMQRGKEQIERAAALVSHYQKNDPTTKVIDFKGYGADGAWWVDSRGVNTLQTASTLILVGTPTPNISALQATFICEAGLDPLDHADQFQAYVDDQTEAEIIQGIGRLRAHRRPGEALQVVILSDFDLSQSGYEITPVKASDITIKAGDRVEQIQAAIVRGFNELTAAGVKVTQAAIAKMVGITQGAISKNDAYRNLLLALIRDSNSKSNNPAIAEMASVAEEALTSSDTPEMVAATIREVFFDWLAPPDWGALIERLSIETKSRAIAVLSIALGHGDELESLAST